MSTPTPTVDLDALAAAIAGQLQDPTDALNDEIAPDGFVRFDVSVPVFEPEQVTLRATVEMASDGEDEIVGAAGETIEIVVRRAS